MKKILVTAMVFAMMLPLFATDKAPEFKLENMKGKVVKLSDFQKEGLVILDFWATWCAPCKKALPKLSKLHEKYENVNVVTICTDKPRKVAEAKKLVKSQKYKFHTLFDTKGVVSKLYNVTSIPHSIMIAPDGTILYDHTGYQDGDEKKMEAVIDKWVQSKKMLRNKNIKIKKAAINPLGKVEKKVIEEEAVKPKITQKKSGTDLKSSSAKPLIGKPEVKKEAVKLKVETTEKLKNVDSIGKVEEKITDEKEEDSTEEAGNK